MWHGSSACGKGAGLGGFVDDFAPPVEADLLDPFRIERSALKRGV